MYLELEKINEMIYVLRGQKVMLDSDLAKLYGVETKVLNQAVKRNLKRFPGDFMLRLSPEEYSNLKSQFVTSSESWGGKRKQPLVFTENGVAMLSGILNSDRAIEVNIAIMRIFTRLRSFMLLEKNLINKIDQLESNTTAVFKVVFEKLDVLVEQLPAQRKDRTKISLNINGN
jgi:hypothetical protein